MFRFLTQWLRNEVVVGDCFMGKDLVTQRQWKEVFGTEPWKHWGPYSNFCNTYAPVQPLIIGDNCPAFSLNWDDAVAFCEKLSEMEGRTYRLPTCEEIKLGKKAVRQAYHIWEFSGDVKEEDFGYRYVICPSGVRHVTVSDEISERDERSQHRWFGFRLMRTP